MQRHKVRHVQECTECAMTCSKHGSTSAIARLLTSMVILASRRNPPDNEPICSTTFSKYPMLGEGSSPVLSNYPGTLSISAWWSYCCASNCASMDCNVLLLAATAGRGEMVGLREWKVREKV